VMVTVLGPEEEEKKEELEDKSMMNKMVGEFSGNTESGDSMHW